MSVASMSGVTKGRYTSQWATRLLVGRHLDMSRIYELVNIEESRAYELVDIEMIAASMIQETLRWAPRLRVGRHRN